MRTIQGQLLDAAQEAHLARQVEAGVYAGHLITSGRHRPGLEVVVEDGRRAWQELWLANVGMVKVLATRYGRRDPDLVDDLIQEGWVALAGALMRYDWTRGARLSTHAWHWVKHHLAHVMRERSAWEARTTPEVPDRPHPDLDDDEPYLRGLLAPLSQLERRVLLARAHGQRQADVAREFGLSLSTARRVEERAARRAREAYLAWAS
ncbi:sigma-70 family RNA polymerase sigma factor [Aestuariimicrobium sp. Y1814]|uniref:sigma-70 family RNA polymerase sigma factor n=1 Tax=Aestuariimicrobium sp. Y1814 TaxID=3418742 RepID=UPI003DA6D525